jgi:seryl-tRNA synthetase
LLAPGTGRPERGNEENLTEKEGTSMSKLTIGLDRAEPDYLSQIRYSLAFVSEDVLSYEIAESPSRIVLEVKNDADVAGVEEKVRQLLQRYETDAAGMKSRVAFEQKRDLPRIDAWAGMLERRWATPIGDGHVILRGPAALLMALVDYKVETIFAAAFDADLEHFPSTIRSETLDRCHHFTSFPEHMDFVAHLKQDLYNLKEFSDGCRDSGWSPALHEGRMSASDFSISPSCCYHAYEGMEGWDIERPGRALTATLHCHRYEGANHRYMTRLRAFTMREVVWVGHPGYVVSNRKKAEELIVQWARDWELSCTFETANDMFFTNEYAVKASFQRQQEAKKELRLDVPWDGQSISCFSSNFHSTIFGKAFQITAGGRPATSGCIAWGYERWVHALLSQFGFDQKEWPNGLREDYQRFVAARRMSPAAHAAAV